MSIITSQQIFYINSADRINGTDSNFTIIVENINKNVNFTHVVVLQAIIPKTYYLVINNNNTFILQEDTNSIEITLPPGNYSKISFKSKLQSLLNSNSPNSFIYKVYDDNISNEPDTGRFYYEVSNNNEIQPSFIMNSELHNQFGLQKDSTNNFINNKLTSTHFINFTLENTLFIHSDICQNTTSNNVLQEIYTAGVATASYIKYDCYQLEAYSKIFNKNSGTYNFYLTNENGIPLDLNGINMEITIMIYKKNTIDDEIRDYIEMTKLKNQLKLMQK